MIATLHRDLDWMTEIRRGDVACALKYMCDLRGNLEELAERFRDFLSRRSKDAESTHRSTIENEVMRSVGEMLTCVRVAIVVARRAPRMGPNLERDIRVYRDDARRLFTAIRTVVLDWSTMETDWLFEGFVRYRVFASGFEVETAINAVQQIAAEVSTLLASAAQATTEAPSGNTLATLVNSCGHLFAFNEYLARLRDMSHRSVIVPRVYSTTLRTIDRALTTLRNVRDAMWHDESSTLDTSALRTVIDQLSEAVRSIPELCTQGFVAPRKLMASLSSDWYSLFVPRIVAGVDSEFTEWIHRTAEELLWAWEWAAQERLSGMLPICQSLYRARNQLEYAVVITSAAVARHDNTKTVDHRLREREIHERTEDLWTRVRLAIIALRQTENADHVTNIESLIRESRRAYQVLRDVLIRRPKIDGQELFDHLSAFEPKMDRVGKGLICGILNRAIDLISEVSSRVPESHVRTDEQYEALNGICRSLLLVIRRLESAQDGNSASNEQLDKEVFDQIRRDVLAQLPSAANAVRDVRDWLWSGVTRIGSDEAERTLKILGHVLSASSGSNDSR